MTFDSPMIDQRRRLEGEESRKRRSIIRLKFSILRQTLQVGMFTLVLACHLVIKNILWGRRGQKLHHLRKLCSQT
jgi:hypothetical protein